MAQFTIELRELVSTFGRDEVKAWFSDYQLSDYLTAEEIRTIEEKGVWSKDQLAERIVDHFYLREICTDSPGSFQLFAKDMMNELMETYAPMIYSSSIKYDPLVNVNYSESFDRTSSNNANTNTTSNNNSSGLSVSSDTPQGRINKAAILEGNYASSTTANENENNSTDSSNSTGNGEEHYVKTTKGNSGVSATSQAMIKQYREVIRAINTEIVYALEPLFIGLY
jgi:hypothetical protein